MLCTRLVSTKYSTRKDKRSVASYWYRVCMLTCIRACTPSTHMRSLSFCKQSFPSPLSFSQDGIMLMHCWYCLTCAFFGSHGLPRQPLLQLRAITNGIFSAGYVWLCGFVWSDTISFSVLTEFEVRGFGSRTTDDISVLENDLSGHRR
jgi:hypothetical protein